MNALSAARPNAGDVDAHPVRVLLTAALLMASFLSLWRLDIPLQGSEGRWAWIALDMLDKRDFLSMSIGGIAYPDKPFGSYWLIVLASLLTGVVDERTARLPGALCFVFTTYVVYLLGKRTIGALPGALAACLFATSFRVVFFSRVASADPQTVLGIALSMLLILEASERPRWWHFPALGAVMGVSSLMKGLVGVAVPCFAAALWTIGVRGWTWLRPVPMLLGVLALLLTLGLPLATPWLTRGDSGPLELLWRESVTRGLSPFDHVQPWYFYFWNQFELLAPWSLLLPAALVLGWRHVRAQVAAYAQTGWSGQARSDDRRRLFPFFAYLVIFLFFTLSGSRRTYYLLPIAPFFSLLAAEALLDLCSPWSACLRRWALAVLAWLGVGLGGAALLLGIARQLYPLTAPDLLNYHGLLLPQYWQAIPPELFVVGAGLVPGLMLWKYRHSRLRAPALAIALVLAIAAGTLGTMEALRKQAQGLQRFCAEVRRIVPEGVAIELLARSEDGLAADLADAPKVLFYLGRPIVKPGAAARFRLASKERALELQAQEPGRYVWRLIEPVSRDPAFDSQADARRRVLLERVD